MSRLTRWAPIAAVLVLALAAFPARGFGQSGRASAKAKAKARATAVASRKDDERTRALLTAHNRERAAAKLPALEIDPKLTAAAVAHAQDMAEQEKMTHDGADGSTFYERINREGYRYKAAAENVAFGRFATAEVMKDWMNSPHHKDNILGPYIQVGFGFAKDTQGRPYWSVEFATPWPKIDTSQATGEVVDALNRERAGERLPPLKINAKLSAAASWGAEKMAALDPTKGTELNGEEIIKKVREQGYRYRALAESSAIGQPKAADAAKSWIDSPPHREHILGEFTEVGVGTATNPKNGLPSWFLILARPMGD